jgi:hypothetical protein
MHIFHSGRASIEPRLVPWIHTHSAALVRGSGYQTFSSDPGHPHPANAGLHCP